MGMFDKDKEIGLIMQRAIPKGEHFIVFSAEVTREDFPTDLGPTAQVTLEIAKMEAPRERFQVTTLAGAIVAKVREAEEDDFPARVFWTTAPSRYAQDATVLQFVAPYDPRVFRTQDQGVGHRGPQTGRETPQEAQGLTPRED